MIDNLAARMKHGNFVKPAQGLAIMTIEQYGFTMEK